MDKIISLEDRRREREQRRISPLLQRAEEMRRAARMLLLNAEIMEMQAYSMTDVSYDEMAEEKVENLRVLHNA